MQAEDQVVVITTDSSSQFVRRPVGRNPSARAAVAQLQDAVKKQEVGLGLAALPWGMLSDISQVVDKLTRGLAQVATLLWKTVLQSSSDVLLQFFTFSRTKI